MVELQKERVTEVFWFICHPVDLQVVDIRSFFHPLPVCLPEISETVGVVHIFYFYFFYLKKALYLCKI